MPAHSPRVAVVGAGLAGLVAAVTAMERGADVTVYERLDTPGGISAESAGWIWRYCDIETFRRCCPLGDVAVCTMIMEHFDADLVWLVEYSGVRVLASDSSRSTTVGVRLDMGATLAALAAEVGQRLHVRVEVVGARTTSGGGIALAVEERRAGHAAEVDPTWIEHDEIIFAGGGHAADTEWIARDAGVDEAISVTWTLRSDRGGNGVSQRVAASLGALESPATGECFARVMPVGATHLAPGDRARFGELLELADAELVDTDGDRITTGPDDWSGAQRAWKLARRGRGSLVLPSSVLCDDLHGMRVEDVLRAGARAGARVRDDGGERIRIDVCAGLTHSIDGLRVDAHARCLQADTRGTSAPLVAVRAAGCDVAGSGAGGYASGLAQALVLGRLAGSI